MDRNNWVRWIIQTAEKWSDIEPVITSSSIDKIDEEHKRLVNYVIDLNFTIRRLDRDPFNPAFINEQRSLFNKIYNYAIEHFKTEEDFMVLYNIDSSQHIAQHQKILRKLEQVMEEFEEGKISASASLKMVIMDWIIEHINKLDKDTFSINNLQTVLIKAQRWDDVKFLIKSCGVEIVDKAHKELVEKTLILEQLKLTNDITTDATNIRSIIKDLFLVVERHFSEEEEFLKKYDLKGFPIQQKQHQIFKSLLQEKMDVSDEDLVSSLRELKVFTIQWWCKHINELDYKTVSFYNTSSDIIDHSTTVEDVIWMMEKFSLKELNDKHHNILRILDDLYKLNMSPNENKKEIEVSRNSFFTSMKELFKYEEKLMKDNGLPNNEHHKRIHKGLIRKYESYFNQVDEGKAVFSIYLRNRLYKSWIRHTNEIDAEIFGDMNDEQ